MKVYHYAVPFNSKEESDRFFCEFLGLGKMRDFFAPKDLMKALFNIDKEVEIVRYGNENIDIEVLIVEEPIKMNKFNHIGLIIEDRDKLLDKAKAMGYETMIHPRDPDSYFLFIKDIYGNLYEIKEM